MRLASQPTNGNTKPHCDVELLLIVTRKLFVLNGFGYAVDSLILLIQSIIAGQAALEFNPGYPNGLTIAAYVGMLVGALFWESVQTSLDGRLHSMSRSLSAPSSLLWQERVRTGRSLDCSCVSVRSVLEVTWCWILLSFSNIFRVIANGCLHLWQLGGVC